MLGRTDKLRHPSRDLLVEVHNVNFSLDLHEVCVGGKNVRPSWLKCRLDVFWNLLVPHLHGRKEEI